MLLLPVRLREGPRPSKMEQRSTVVSCEPNDVHRRESLLFLSLFLSLRCPLPVSSLCCCRSISNSLVIRETKESWMIDDEQMHRHDQMFDWLCFV